MAIHGHDFKFTIRDLGRKFHPASSLVFGWFVLSTIIKRIRKRGERDSGG